MPNPVEVALNNSPAGCGVPRGRLRLRGQILALVLLLLRVVLLLLLVVAAVVVGVVRVVVVVEGGGRLLHLKLGALCEFGRRGTPFGHWYDDNVQGNRGLWPILGTDSRSLSACQSGTCWNFSQN